MKYRLSIKVIRTAVVIAIIAGEIVGRFRCFFREVFFFRREGVGWLRRI